MRLLIWSMTGVMCLGGYLLNCCLRQSPAAFESLHNTRGWVPLDSLDEEARLFVADYYSHAHLKLARHRRERHFVWPDPYGLCTGFLYEMTLEDDQILQLTFSKSTQASPVGTIDLATVVELVHWPSDKTKAGYPEFMLKRGHISPGRYRELKKNLVVEH